MTVTARMASKSILETSFVTQSESPTYRRKWRTANQQKFHPINHPLVVPSFLPSTCLVRQEIPSEQPFLIYWELLSADSICQATCSISHFLCHPARMSPIRSRSITRFYSTDSICGGVKGGTLIGTLNVMTDFYCEECDTLWTVKGLIKCRS